MKGRVVGVSCQTLCDKSNADLLHRLMTSHPQDKADKSIRLTEKGAGFVTIAKRICYNDKKGFVTSRWMHGRCSVAEAKS